MEWSSLKGRGPRWFTIKKTKKQTCFTKTWHFDCLFGVFFSLFFFFFFFIGNLLSSSFTQFLVVLFFIAFYTALFCSKHFFLVLFLRSLSTQLFFLLVFLILLLSMTPFSYVGLLSLFWVRLFYALYLGHLPPSSFLEELSSEQFAELGAIHLLAFSSGLFVGFPIFSVSVLSNLQGRFHILSSFFGFVLIPFFLWWLCWFQLFWGLIFLIFLRDFSCVFYRAFLLFGSVLSSRAALSSENACSYFLCRWHVTATLTGWFHP